MKKNKAINAILIDDDQDFSRALSDSANRHQIIITCFTNLEDGLERISEKSKQIDFVIIDGQCNEHDGSTETSLRVPSRGKEEIDRLNREKNTSIRYCIYTAFPEKFEDIISGIEILEKKDHTSADKLFEYIKHSVKNAGDYKLKNKYKSSFKVFDQNIIDEEYIHILIDILRSIENKDYKKKNLNVQRGLLEAIYIGLNKNIGLIPDEFFNNNRPNLWWCMLFLEGKEVENEKFNKKHKINSEIPDQIRPIFRFLHFRLNKYSHLGPNEIVKNQFLSCAYALLEIIDWLPEFVDSNFE